MTRREAEQLIASIRAGEVQLRHSRHSREQLASRGFNNDDVDAILQSHVLEHAPEWSEEHANFKVSLRGKFLEGRPSRVVLGLRLSGPCLLVTIMLIGSKR